MRSTVYLTLAGLCLAVRAAAAQGSCDDIGRYFAQPPKLGDWAEMRMDRKKDEGKKPVLMRIAFVDREQREGRPLYRMQMVMNQDDGKRQIMQVLTPWGADALDRDYDSEVVMKLGTQPAMVMPIKAGKGPPGLSDIRKQCAKINFVGEETVVVPAGSFKTRHYAGPDGDSWISTAVPGWRMVKMVTKEGDTMVLTATGAGAKNEIVEKPMDMKAMMGNSEAMKRMMEGRKGQEAK